MSPQSRPIHFLFVSNVQHPDKGQPLKLTTPFVASSSHILKNHMTQSDKALLIVRRIGSFCYLLRSVKCQRKRNDYFGHTSLDCSQCSRLVPSERTFKWSVFWGEPAEHGPGKVKANWSRKCHFLTLSRGRLQPETVSAQHQMYIVGTKWTKGLSPIKQGIPCCVTLFRNAECSSAYCTCYSWMLGLGGCFVMSSWTRDGIRLKWQ